MVQIFGEESEIEQKMVQKVVREVSGDRVEKNKMCQTPPLPQESSACLAEECATRRGSCSLAG